MATVNQYKFLGTNIATDVEQTILTPARWLAQARWRPSLLNRLE